MFIDKIIIVVVALAMVSLIVKIARLSSKIHTLQKIVHKLENADEEEPECFSDSNSGGAEGRD